MQEFHKGLLNLNRQEDRAFNVGASCGAMVFRLNSLSTIEECVQKSDEEMYREKDQHHIQREN